MPVLHHFPAVQNPDSRMLQLWARGATLPAHTGCIKWVSGERLNHLPPPSPRHSSLPSSVPAPMRLSRAPAPATFAPAWGLGLACGLVVTGVSASWREEVPVPGERGGGQRRHLPPARRRPVPAAVLLRPDHDHCQEAAHSHRGLRRGPRRPAPAGRRPPGRAPPRPPRHRRMTTTAPTIAAHRPGRALPRARNRERV